MGNLETEYISKDEILQIINDKFYSLSKNVQTTWKDKLIQSRTLTDMLNMLKENISEEIVKCQSFIELDDEEEPECLNYDDLDKLTPPIVQKPVVKKNELGFTEVAFPKSF